MGSLAFCALPLRFATRHGAKELVGTCPVGFARAEGARSTHGYVPIAAMRLTFLNSYKIPEVFTTRFKNMSEVVFHKRNVSGLGIAQLTLLFVLAFGVYAAEPTDYFKVLKRTDTWSLYDNVMNCHRLRDIGGIGFCSWYKLPRIRKTFIRQTWEKSAVLTLVLDGQPVAFSAIEEASYWECDRMTVTFSGEGVTVREEIAILDDRVGLRIHATGLKGKRGIWMLTLKSMCQGIGRIEDGIIRFDMDRDCLKGYTHYFALNRPEIGNAVFQDVKVKPIRSFYGSQEMIDTESRAVVEIPLDGTDDAFDCFLVTSVTDAPGPAETAKLAALTAKPEHFFAARHKEWADFFQNAVPYFASSDLSLVQFYAWSYYAFKADCFRTLDGLPDYICPSKEGDWLPFGWDEDSAHIVTGARWLEGTAMQAMVERMVFHFLQPSSPLNFGLTTMSGWEVFLRTGDLDFLRRLYDAVLCNSGKYEKFMKDGMIVQTDSFLVGWDNSSRYAWGGFNKNLNKFERPILPVDLNSYRVRELEILAQAAELLGKGEEAARHRAEGHALAERVNKLMWDEESGFYYDIFADDHTQLRCRAASGFTPLMAGIPSPQQAQKVVALLKDPQEFGTRYAVPTIAMSYPQRSNTWSGDICGRNNYLVEIGLARYDRDSTAWITRKTMELFMRPQGGYASGYQKPDRLVNNHMLFITEMAGGLDMMVKHVIGFMPEPDGFSILPAALDPQTAYLAWTIDFRGRRVKIIWDRPNDGIMHFPGVQEGYTIYVDDITVLHDAHLPTKRHHVELKGAAIRK